MELKGRLGKVENGQECNSETKHFKNAEQSNTNIDKSSRNPENAVKGESGNDVLQFPLGVSIKKEVMEPRDGEGGYDEDEMDSDDFDVKTRKMKKRQSLAQGPIMAGKLHAQMMNQPDSEEDSIETLKKVVSEISDAGQIWKVVRSRILSQCQIWDLLMDKVFMDFRAI